MPGRDAAELFYDPQRFVRQGAAPEPVRATLLGKGGVQGLDDDQHRSRKAMFVSLLMGPDRVESLVAEVERAWLEEAVDWVKRDEVVLYSAIQRVLTGSVCRWAGVNRRTRELTALFVYAMGGPLELALPDDAPLSVVARYRGPDGELLTPRYAAVELLNILRPVVAVFVVQTVHALHKHRS